MRIFLINYLGIPIPNHWTRKYAKNGPPKTRFSCNFQAWTIRRIVCMKVGYRMSDSLSDYPTIKKSDYPLPVRALAIDTFFGRFVIENLLLYILGIKVRNIKMDFNIYDTWRRVGQ